MSSAGLLPFKFGSISFGAKPCCNLLTQTGHAARMEGGYNAQARIDKL
jgi:hypothetical protein